jgi:hypothetical protein
MIPAPAAAPEVRPVVDRFEGPATVAAATVAYDREGPAWGLAVCDVGSDGARGYARIEAPELLADAAAGEWTGRSVTVSPHPSRDGANLVVA